MSWDGLGPILGRLGAVLGISEAVLGLFLWLSEEPSKSLKNHWFFNDFGGSGGVWGRSLGGLGAVLGRLGASWAVCGWSWGGLGAVLGRSWGVLGGSGNAWERYVESDHAGLCLRAGPGFLGTGSC